MMHFSCDLCGKDIRPEDDQRFVVKMEIYPAQDPAEITEADLDDDNLEEVSQLLRDLEDGAEPALEETAKDLRFDLCCECKQRFLRDPLGKEHAQKLFFSKN